MFSLTFFKHSSPLKAVSTLQFNFSKDLKEIFIPFKKSTETKNTIYSGVGVGLSITKILLDKIGGEIKIASKYKKGTQVKINIKASEVVK